MNPSDLPYLKQLAMQAEMARPIAHECNNFLNNLMLQLAISEKSLPEAMRTEWANVRREGRKLAALLQQWQRQRKQPADGPDKIELNQLIQDVVEEYRSESNSFQLKFHPAGEPLRLSGYAGDVQRLVFLLLRYTIDALEATGVDAPAIVIELARHRDRIVLRLRDAEGTNAKLLWSDFDDAASCVRSSLSLPALTCKSLVERLEGEICIEQDSTSGTALTIDLPLAPP